MEGLAISLPLASHMFTSEQSGEQIPDYDNTIQGNLQALAPLDRPPIQLEIQDVPQHKLIFFWLEASDLRSASGSCLSVSFFLSLCSNLYLYSPIQNGNMWKQIFIRQQNKSYF